MEWFIKSKINWTGDNDRDITRIRSSHGTVYFCEIRPMWRWPLKKWKHMRWLKNLHMRRWLFLASHVKVLNLPMWCFLQCRIILHIKKTSHRMFCKIICNCLLTSHTKMSLTSHGTVFQSSHKRMANDSCNEAGHSLWKVACRPMWRSLPSHGKKN